MENPYFNIGNMSATDKGVSGEDRRGKRYGWPFAVAGLHGVAGQELSVDFICVIV